MSTFSFARTAQFLRQGPRHWLEASRIRSKTVSELKAVHFNGVYQEATQKVDQGAIACVVTGSRDRRATVRLAALKALIPAALDGSEAAIRVALDRLLDSDTIVRTAALTALQDIAKSGSDGAVVLAIFGLRSVSKGPRFYNVEHDIAMKALCQRVSLE
mmetsp:Transcript_13959/g.30375  ORF Transcript_13959/g.30375 Transcript_13959/m.30375 type:complete len:159 (+) Transcript_13959:153-629(+)